jgi:protein SCO1/2
MVTDGSGGRRNLLRSVVEPAVLVFADYTCTTLCGPIVAFVSAALAQSGLPATRFRLFVVGLDPKDTAADAERMRQAHLDPASPVNAATTFFTTDEADVHKLTAALGYRYAYDREADQFVHPGAAYVLTADGRVARVLTGLGISAGDLRLALVEASDGRLGTFDDKVRLLCSGFDPAHGTYNLLVSRLLAASAIATMLALAGGVALLWRMGPRHPA